MNTLLTHDLVRTGGGRVAHRLQCSYVTRAGVTSTAVPWLWAKGRDVEEVRLAMPMCGVRACAYCRPLDLSYIP